MNQSPIDEHLLLHATIILLAGLICGAPMEKAIVQNASADKINAWRVAHSGLSMGGIMLMVLAVVIALLDLQGVRYGLIFTASLVSGYGFLFALPLGARTGNRGLSSQGSWTNRVVHVGNILGAYGSLVSVATLLVTVVFRLID